MYGQTMRIKIKNEKLILRTYEFTEEVGRINSYKSLNIKYLLCVLCG